MKRKPKQTTLRQFDFFEVMPAPTKRLDDFKPDLDPIAQAIFGVTEAEFYAMFEQPSGPNEK